MKPTATGHCEHCRRSFGYYLVHSGFGDCSYAYCDHCGRTAILSYWNVHFPKSAGYARFEEIPPEMESHLKVCQCGGSFRKGAAPRCPHCNQRLSPEFASTYIEANAEGTQKGWRWQKSWDGLYCIVVEGKSVEDNFSS